jgi:hypothetical protein
MTGCVSRNPSMVAALSLSDHERSALVEYLKTL